MAAVLVLEPIFEADLPPEQYAYRPDRSALDAVKHVHQLLNTGHGQIVDADLAGYFDSIPHAELLKSVARRVVDGSHAASDQDVAGSSGGRDRRAREQASDDPQSGRRNGDAARGSDQPAAEQSCTCAGSCWDGRSWGTRSVLQAYIVNYADDFVICCRGQADEALARHAGHDGEAEADGERDEDAGLPPAGGEVRLSGVHVRSVLLAEDGTRLSGHGSVEEEGAAHLRGDQ